MADRTSRSRSDDEWTEVAETPFEIEDELEEVVAANPQLLCDSFTQGFPQRLLLVGRQQPVRASEQGALVKGVDLLFVDQDAVPTLVEVKLRKNSESKRYVIGQMLEYAARSKFWTAQDLRATVTKTHGDARQVICKFIGESVADDHEESFWQAVAENLSSGKMHLGLVADEIREETQDVLEFLQERIPTISVFGIEIKAVADIAGGYQSRLVAPNPRLREERAKRTRPQTETADKYSRNDLFNEVPEAVSALRSLLRVADEHGCNQTTGTSSFSIRLQPNDYPDEITLAWFISPHADLSHAWGEDLTFGTSGTPTIQAEAPHVWQIFDKWINDLAQQFDGIWREDKPKTVYLKIPYKQLVEHEDAIVAAFQQLLRQLTVPADRDLLN